LGYAPTSISAGEAKNSAGERGSLGELARLSNYGNFLLADGIWRADNPTVEIETSVAHLECYKSGGQEIVGSDSYCMEATATITFGDIPSVDVRYYSVVSWDANRVIASDSPTGAFPICTWTQITINLHDQSIMATDTRKLAKGHEGFKNVCETLPLAQTYHLLDQAGELVRMRIEASRREKQSGKTDSPAK
jgi:hypothetical protein